MDERQHVTQLADALETIRESKQPGFFVYTPKGKPRKLKRSIPAGSSITFTTRDGKTAVEIEEPEGAK